MTQHVEVFVSATIPDGDGFVGHEALVAAREPTNAVVKALEAKGAIDIKATCRLVNNKRKTPVGSVDALHAVPYPDTGDQAA